MLKKLFFFILWFLAFTPNTVAFTQQPSGMVSVYDDDLEGDYVLDEYGIRDWFDEKCTYKGIALGTITRTFKIIGL